MANKSSWQLHLFGLHMSWKSSMGKVSPLVLQNVFLMFLVWILSIHIFSALEANKADNTIWYHHTKSSFQPTASHRLQSNVVMRSSRSNTLRQQIETTPFQKFPSTNLNQLVLAQFVLPMSSHFQLHCYASRPVCQYCTSHGWGVVHREPLLDGLSG